MLLKLRDYDLQTLTCRLCTRFGLCTWFCTEARNLSRTDPPASRQEKGWLTTTISITLGNNSDFQLHPHKININHIIINKSNSLLALITRKTSWIYPLWLSGHFVVESTAAVADLVVDAFDLAPVADDRVRFRQRQDADSAGRSANVTK